VTEAGRADPDLSALARFACEVAERAGGLADAGRRRGGFAVRTKSSATDLVTEMDTAAEDLIVAAIRAERSDDGIVGEEGAAVASQSGITWLIDPIDGTTNFAYGIPGWSVSIGAVDAASGERLAGAVVVPPLRERYLAWRGGGAWVERDDARERLAVARPATLASSLLATGFGYTPERRVEHAHRLTHVIGKVRDIRRVGSAALDLCMVASGRLDAYWEIGINPWDVAAGALIAHEAGAVVRVDGPEVFAASPTIADELASVIAGAATQ
jgi:myo-inositol-1(or 4)-monophosphatase